MLKKYIYKDFIKDPRTYSPSRRLPRHLQALFNCIDNNKITPQEIFAEIDKTFTTGKHRSPSYIRYRKEKAIKLFNSFIF